MFSLYLRNEKRYCKYCFVTCQQYARDAEKIRKYILVKNKNAPVIFLKYISLHWNFAFLTASYLKSMKSDRNEKG